MTAQVLLSRLERVRRTGQGKWIARCPSHDDRGPSLTVAELEDGRVLVHCHAGCSMWQIVSGARMDVAELFPPREPPGHFTKRERRPFAALDILRCIDREVLIVATSAMRVANGFPLSDEERERLRLAAIRLNAACDLAEGA